MAAPVVEDRRMDLIPGAAPESPGKDMVVGGICQISRVG